MRKIKVKALALAAILSLSFLGACSGNDDTSGESTPEVNTGKTLMNGFEVFDRDIQLIRLFNEFGRLDENSDKKFVRSGEKSLKITPLGSRVHNANPFFVLPTYSIRFEEVAYGDFSNVDKISFWFYNNEENAVNVGIGFATGVLKMSTSNRRDTITKTSVEYFSLNKGWNYIEYNVEPAYLAMQDLDISEVYGVAVEFDHIASNDLEDSPEVYLDDVELVYTDVKKSTQFMMNVETGKTAEGQDYWQISDFENALEAYYYSYMYSFPAPAAGHPIIKPVFAGDYGVVTTKGLQALLIQQKHGGGVYGWPSVMIDEEVMKAVVASIGEDIKTNPQNYALKFDLYNASHTTTGFSVNFQNSKHVVSFRVEPGHWSTFSTTIDKIDAGVKAEKEVFTKAPGHIRFSWSGYYDSGDLADRPLLLDNVRIEKIAE